MRRITLGGTGITTSCLGFGCAGLGSRVDARTGRRALEEALDGGVTWFDLAPVYGGGEAEAIAAPFLAAHRGAVQVCTKAGVGFAGGAGGLRRRLAPLAWRALSAAGPLARPLQAGLRRAAPAANVKLPLTPALLRAGIEASLRRLGTDHVALFALHGPTPGELADHEIRRTLEDIVAAGMARAVAVAGDAAAAAAALGVGAPYGVVQLPLPAPGAPAGLLGEARAAGFGVITHSVFAGAVPPGPEDRAGLAGGRLRRAFALNPEGIVLASMFSATRRRADLAVAAEPPGLPAPGEGPA